jgi:glycerol kinase
MPPWSFTKMFEKYILGIDQSTSGTKAMLLDSKGDLTHRFDVSHRQLVDDRGWVEHDPIEIYENTVEAVKNVVMKSGIDKAQIIGVGISNQRETALVWDKNTGRPVHNAIVWQCVRGEAICARISHVGYSEKIKAITGLNLSPYFSASKIAWILENVNTNDKKLCAGTIDSWLLFKLTGNFRTDYSNASRTQLFDLSSKKWSDEVCGLFGIDPAILPVVCDSNSCFGHTDFDGFLKSPIPIHGVMGDSHAALYGQGCFDPGMMKATYGTGSSIMMNIGGKPIYSDKGVVTSIAWGIDGKVEYVLEGNINYTGAVIKWIVEDLGLLESTALAEKYAFRANTEDETYLVPAFTGLSAPHWNNKARAIICGMSRTTGKAEIVKAANECIAYQIADVINSMSNITGLKSESLRVDGGATENKYLMQFQSDILNLPIIAPIRNELSGIGVSCMAGIALDLYDKDEIFSKIKKAQYMPQMSDEVRNKKYKGWQSAVTTAVLAANKP